MKNCLAMLLLIMAAISFAGCSGKNNDFAGSTEAVSEIQAQDQLDTATQFGRLRNNQPPPTDLEYSQERYQLNKRFRRFNTADKTSYIYLVDFGKIMGFFVIKGKVSSVNSKMTCTQQTVYDGKGTSRGRDGVHVVESPALDGSFGTNGDAVFFFTDTDIYVEWNGIYMLCDEYIKMAQPPELVVPTDVNLSSAQKVPFRKQS